MSFDPLDLLKTGVVSSCCGARVTELGLCATCHEHCDEEKTDEEPSHEVRCPHCYHGRCSVDGDRQYTCPDCGGSGRITVPGCDPTDRDDQD
jgi:hypothetical protein